MVNLRLASPRENLLPAPCGAIGHFILQAGDDIAARCHGSGNYALLARFHLDCAFPCYPYVLIEVVFSLRKIVMTIDTVKFDLLLMTIFRVKDV